MYSDFLLIRKMKQGDDIAFELFVRKYYEKILAYCRYHCYDNESAEDLTQETFIRFFARLSGYRYIGKTINYLYTIAGNLCKDYLKKIRDIPVENTELIQETEDGKHQMDFVLNKIYIEKVLKELPKELQDVVFLYYFQELKQTEIADQLQISLPLVKYRLKQAKIKLENLL